MITAMAGSGQFGRLVVDRLLERVPPGEVAVAVRDTGRAADLAARGVAVRHGDFDDPASLRAAFAGTDVLLFISGPTEEPGARVPQHRNVVDAAVSAGVGAIVYTSGLGADFVEDGLLGEHHATEQAVRDSGLPHTFLRHPIYSDFFFHAGLRAAVESGELTGSVGARGLNTASRADLAEAAAVVLTDGERRGGAYDFTGPRWSYPELAEVLGELGGRPVTYREVEEDEGILAMIGPAVRSGAFERQTGDLAQVLGHPATSLESAVAAALGARA